MTDKPRRTPRGIEVQAPGVYRAYCNECGWRAPQTRPTLPDATKLARSHRCK